MRATRKSVTFKNSFFLPGVDGTQPKGTYAVVTEGVYSVIGDEDEAMGISSMAWRQLATWLQLPSLDTAAGHERLINISSEDLAAALENDDMASNRKQPNLD